MANLRSLLQNNYRTFFAVGFLMLVFHVSKQQNYVLFHTLVELFSIVVAFAVFIVTWNSRNMQDNKFLHLVGISYIFVGALDLLHTLTFKGMNIIPIEGFLANQFWVATRMLAALTLLGGLLLIKRQKKLNSDLTFLGYFFISFLITLSILVWKVFPVCFIDGVGQTPFKIYMEYSIISVLFIAACFLIRYKAYFSTAVYRYLLGSMIFTILSEFCFTLYVSNFGSINEIGHYGKLIAFFLIYKANVETGFIKPTHLIFKNLKESEVKYRTLAENLPGLIFRFNEELKCIYANNADHNHTLIQMLRPVLTRTKQFGLSQQDSFEITLATGGLQFYAVQIIPEFETSNDGGSYLVICQDVTDLKNTEQKLQSLNKTKDKLFSIIAHDLKNPFASLITFSELIAKKAETLERTKIVHLGARMNESAKQAYALLENLLSWSRVQTGLLRPMPVAIKVAALFEEIIALKLPIAQAKGINLIFADPKNIAVLADRQMVATTLRNLISNALKFSYQGSEVKIEVTTTNGTALFAVVDSGTGILEENQKHLLEVGNEFSSPGTAAEKGTGLGLVLCKEFVELNGGEIFLKSEFGLGTTFYFTLPLA